MIRICFGVAATILALCVDARADWQFTRWNMTESALRDAATKNGVTLTPTSAEEKLYHSGPTIIDPTGKTPDHQASLAYWKAEMPSYFKGTAFFMLDDSKRLVQISLIVPSDQCGPFNQALIFEYGKPTQSRVDNSPGGVVAIVWHSLRKDEVWFMWQHALAGNPAIGITCSADWMP